MSTTNITVNPATAKSSVGLNSILNIINLALQGLSLLPIVGAPAGIADIFVQMFQHASAAYTEATGQPFDITKIPLEQPVP